MTELLIIGGAIALGYYFTRNSDNPLMEPVTTNVSSGEKLSTSVDRNLVAYVTDKNGAPIYGSVSDTYIPISAYGRDYVMTFPYKTYLGKTTGNYRNELLELATTINTKTVKFWANTKNIKLIDQATYDRIQNTEILPKSDDDKVKLLKL